MFQKENEYEIGDQVPFLEEFQKCTEKYVKTYNRIGITEGEVGLLLCLALLYHQTQKDRYYQKRKKLKMRMSYIIFLVHGSHR
jgi:hypothetical protein